MLALQASTYCCGMVELGNFNYVKSKGPGGLPHYHKVGGWVTQQAAPPTPEAEIRDFIEQRILNYYGGVICSTGADQEYLDDILPKLGFVRFDFTNKVHEKGVVKVWLLATSKYRSEKTKDQKEKAPSAKKEPATKGKSG